MRTPFERSDGAAWTTVAQENRFLSQLDRTSGRVVVDTVGSTVQGRPMQLVQVGAPPSPQPETAEGAVVFFVCSVHGDEPSGREACMIMARDLAFTDDPAWTRLLRDTTVLFMTANPDGHELNARGNAGGFDINRDYMAQATPEGRATGVIRDWQPDVLNDLHEYGPDPDYYRTDLLHLWPRNRNVDDEIYRFAKQLNHEYVAAQVEGSGFSAGIYGELVKDGEPFLQVAGDDRRAAGLGATGTAAARDQVGVAGRRCVRLDAQPDQPLIPLLFDARPQYRLLETTVVNDC